MSQRKNRHLELQKQWAEQSRWQGITRPYSAEAVEKLRGNLTIEFSYAKHTARILWEKLNTLPYINALGALTGNQAVQMAQAGLHAIYVSGWQIAADGNAANQMYPDMALYPSNSVPSVVKKLSNSLLRADQIRSLEGDYSGSLLLPMIADGDTGFGNALSSYELMMSMLEAGAAGVHFEDQHASAKKCGHLGGKVLVPTRDIIERLIAARLAADVADVPALILARTDANGAFLITSDIDEYDHAFIKKERSPEGFYAFKGGIDAAIARGLAVAPYSDLIWCETATPNLIEAKKFAEAIHDKFPNKMLAYNCSPSFNWKKYLSDSEIAHFQRELGAMGYKFQFITLAGFHTINYSMYMLAKAYANEGMSAYVRFQEDEFQAEKSLGFTAVRHQRQVGTQYFDQILHTVSRGKNQTGAMVGSTESEQFSENVHSILERRREHRPELIPMGKDRRLKAKA